MVLPLLATNMLKKRDEKRLQAKMEEWDTILRGFDKAINQIKKELRISFNSMINFILFYKPKNKFDKMWHVCEMVIIYIIVSYAFKGMMGL